MAVSYPSGSGPVAPQRLEYLSAVLARVTVAVTALNSGPHQDWGAEG